MVIRQQQLEVLSRYMRQRFEDRMVHHLRANFADRTQKFDEQGLRTLIVEGIERAEGYDIALEEDIRRFLEYMMVLSEDFDTNPATSWAGDILRRSDAGGSRKIARIDNAYVFSRKGRA